MPAIEKVSIADVPPRTNRCSKTSPLREAILELKPEEACFVQYHDGESGEGYKRSTVAQVVGRLSKDSSEYRYSVRSDFSKNGCYILCSVKSDD
jgi:hypothetical protein